MPNIKRILVPVDFSDISRKALSHGISVASRCQAELLVAHIVEPSAIASLLHLSQPDAGPALAEAKTQLQNWLPNDLTGSAEWRCLVASGEAEEQIRVAVDDNDADLVVMGTHGRRAMTEWFLGSVAGRTLRAATVPVITISQSANDDGSWPTAKGRFMYATDLSHQSKDGSAVAEAWARHFQAELTIVHVMEPWSGILSGRSEADHNRTRASLLHRLEDSVPARKSSESTVRCEIIEGVPYKAVLEAADRWDIDLIMVHLRGGDRVPRPLLGSTAERIVRGAQVPVLSLP